MLKMKRRSKQQKVSERKPAEKEKKKLDEAESSHRTTEPMPSHSNYNNSNERLNQQSVSQTERVFLAQSAFLSNNQVNSFYLILRLFHFVSKKLTNI